MLDDETWALVSWWQEHRRLGILPFPGAMADQPAVVLDVFRACDSAMAEVESEQRRKADQSAEEEARRAAELARKGR